MGIDKREEPGIVNKLGETQGSKVAALVKKFKSKTDFWFDDFIESITDHYPHGNLNMDDELRNLFISGSALFGQMIYMINNNKKEYNGYL